MAHHEFLRRLGIYTAPRFLGQDLCERWRRQAQTSASIRSRVFRNQTVQLDEEQRKSLEVKTAGTELAGLLKKLAALRPDLERHFGVDLGDMEAPVCLVYGPGDFFAIHQDASPSASAHFNYLEQRRVSVVIFLNEPSHPSEPFEGGELTFYGLTKMPGAEQFGFPVDAETGLLVAFPSTTLHQVSRIVTGQRYTLVTWFRSKEGTTNQHADHDTIQTEATPCD